MSKLLFILIPFVVFGVETPSETPSETSSEVSSEIQSENAGFMTQQEYGKRLYNNPRGISCAKCHGDNGEGKTLAAYQHKTKSKELIAPKINSLDFKAFSKGITQKKRRSFMPTYYLTIEEISAIYEYINIKKK